MKKLVSVIMALILSCGALWAQAAVQNGFVLSRGLGNQLFSIGGQFGVDWMVHDKGMELPIEIGGLLQKPVLRVTSRSGFGIDLTAGVSFGGLIGLILGDEAKITTENDKIVYGSDDNGGISYDPKSVSTYVNTRGTWYLTGQLGLNIGSLETFSFGVYGEVGYFDGLPGWGFCAKLNLYIVTFSLYGEYAVTYSPFRERYYDRYCLGVEYLFR